MATAERQYADVLVHDAHECHKQHRRDASMIRILRVELEAARDAIDELERDIAVLEADPPM